MNPARGDTMSDVEVPLTVLATDPALLERYQPGPLALAALVILAGTLWLLYRSMKRQLARIDFDATATDDAGRMRGGASQRGDHRAAGGADSTGDIERPSGPEGPDGRGRS